MCNRCGSCDTTGKETYAGELYESECETKCLNDPTCSGIDYSHQMSPRYRECYLNHALQSPAKKHSDFNSWTRQPSGKNFLYKELKQIAN